MILDKEEKLEALIESDVITDTIKTEIKGRGNKRSLLSFIRKIFEEIHEGFPKLKIEQMIPIKDTGEFVKYSILKIYLEEGQEYYFDHLTKKPYKVKELLEGIVIKELDDLKKLIALSKLEEVFKLLEEVNFSKNIEKDIIQQKIRWNRLNKDHQIGVIDNNEFNLEHNRINFALLEILEEI